MITVTAFNWVPDFARGVVRDVRVRWALEEMGRPYKVRLIDHETKNSADYRGTQQPFGQVPVLQDGDLTLFESGAILLHLANQSEALAPAEANARARVTAWLFAALNSMEPAISQLGGVDLFYARQDWAKGARPVYEAAVSARLASLSGWLDGREWLEANRFTVADLIMSMVLRNLKHTDLVSGHAVLGPYLERCLARPAFARALEAHLADLTGAPPAAM